MKKAMKKLLAMGLATILLASMMAVAVSATETTAEPAFSAVELFTNGGFESSTTSKFDGSWGTQKPSTSDTLVTSLETSVVHSGAKAFKMETKNKTASENQRGIYGSFTHSSQANCVSEISGWVNVAALSEGSYVSIAYLEGGAQYTKKKSEQLFKNVTDGWTKFSISLPNYVSNTVYISVWIFGVGTVYVDDVSVKDVNSLLPTDFGYNWMSTQYAGSSVSGTNHYATTAENYEGSGSLYLGAGTAPNGTYYGSPRIYTTIGNRVTLEEGAKYRLSFRYKPLKEGNTPARVHIGWYVNSSTTPYDHIYQQFRYAENLIAGDVDNGWQEYHAYFTMPALTANSTPAIMLYCNGTSSNGYYDSFYMAEDYEEEMEVVNASGKAVESIAPGETIYLKKHIISDKNEAAGGKKITMIAAVYETANGNKVLKDVKVEDKIVYDGVNYMYGTDVWSVKGADDVTMEYTVPATAEGKTVTAFCWEPLGKLSPLDGSIPVAVVTPAA